MSNPSFSNIDKWLFEYYEGNLSEEQIAQLETFILLNPDADIDKDMWEHAKVEYESHVYPHQDRLQKAPRDIVWYIGSSAMLLLVVWLGIFSWNSSILEENTKLAGTSSSSSANNTTVQHPVITQLIAANKQARLLQSEELKNTPSTTERNAKSLADHPTSLSNKQDDLPTYYAENSLWNNIEKSPTIDVSENAIVAINYNNIVGSYPSTIITDFPLTDEKQEDNLERIKLTPKEVRFATLHNELVSEYDEIQEEIEMWKVHRKKERKKLDIADFFQDVGRDIRRMADNPIALVNLKDPHYHVPGMQSADINFSSVGTLLATRIQTNSRYQWAEQENQQLYNQLSVDSYVYALRGGIGVQASQSLYNGNGIMNTNVGIIYSPKLSINRNFTLEPAVRLKIGNKSVQASKIEMGTFVEDERGKVRQFYDENDVYRGGSQWYKDLGASVLLNSKWFYVGAQMDNLFRHHDNVYAAGNGSNRSDYRNIITLGTDYQSQNRNLALSPYLVYQNYEDLNELWLGTNFRAHWFTIGAAVSSNLEPAASLGVKFKRFALTYNADLTHSYLAEEKALSHQLSIRFLTKSSRIKSRLLKF